jgi:hypothetical protein
MHHGQRVRAAKLTVSPSERDHLRLIALHVPDHRVRDSYRSTSCLLYLLGPTALRL